MSYFFDFFQLGDMTLFASIWSATPRAVQAALADKKKQVICGSIDACHDGAKKSIF